ncbi:hypothetical protein BDR22DRAFT_826861 [Usnea florida]
MDQHADKHEAPEPAQARTGTLLLKLVGLVVLCFVVDVMAAVFRGIGSFIKDTRTAVLNGKYISIEVSTLTDAQEVIIGQVERQAMVWLPNGQGSAGEDVTPGTIPGAFETSDGDRTSLRSNSEGVEAQADLMHSLADGQACVGVDSEDPLPVQPEIVDAPADQQASVKAGVDVEYNSSEQYGVVKELGSQASRLSSAIVSRRSKLSEGRSSSIQKDTTAKNAYSSGVRSASARIRKATVASAVYNRTTARNVAGVPRRRRARVSHLKKGVGREGLVQAWPDEQAVADDVVGLGGDVPASNSQAILGPILRSGVKEEDKKTRGLVRFRVAELSGIYKARIGQLKVTLRSVRATKNRIRRAAGSCVKSEGRMIGLVFETPEQAMIGSDSEAEMEIDDATPTVGDDKVLVGDPMDLDDGAETGDPMDLDDSTEGTGDSMELDVSQDGPRFETIDTGNSSSASTTATIISLAPAQVGQRPDATDAGVSRSMDGNQERNTGKVDRGKLLEKLNREKAELALRQTSTNVADKVATKSHRDAALEQSTQEHTSPVAAPETGNTAPRGLEGATKPLGSLHSAEDLKEARRGKKPETKAVPEEVKIPTPSPAQPEAPVGVQPASLRVSPPPASSPVSTSIPEENETSQPDTPDTTSSAAMTPTSTLPSSTASTAPTSPQTTTPRSSGSSSAGSSTAGDKASRKRKVVKRRSDDKKPRANPKKASPHQSEDDQDTPTTPSKRSQKSRPEKATDDQEAQFAAPMTQAEIDAQILEAQFGTQPDSDTDLDWPSDED